MYLQEEDQLVPPGSLLIFCLFFQYITMQMANLLKDLGL